MRRSLAMLVALAVVGSAVVLAATPSFVGAEKCKPCHLPEYTTWTTSAHAAATEAGKAGDEWGPACLKCHATNNTETMAGVQCEECHGAGSEYSTIAVMMDKKKAAERGLAVRDQALCDECHDGQDHHKKAQLGKFKHDHREKHGVVELD